MSLREKDYIMKLLEQFYLALNKFLYGETEEKIDFLAFEEKFYSGYLENTSHFFLTSSPDEIIDYIRRKFPEKEFVVRLEIACELMFQNLENNNKNRKDSLPEKLLELYNRLDSYTKTYSIEREYKLKYYGLKIHRFNMRMKFANNSIKYEYLL
ncbi:hypothetical protein TRIP_D260049 [uncultured Paludibacter sp.]|nr:hypothetical protein TRIP_D260049 [uncultured Paludibacter sp.]